MTFPSSRYNRELRNPPKDTHLQIRLSRAQKRLIEQQSRRANTNPSKWVLSKLLGSMGEKFETIPAELSKADDAQPVWAALHDFLNDLSISEFQSALPSPGPDLSPLEANLVAAMLEVSARQKGIAPPAWTSEIDPLEQPWFATQLKSLRPFLLVHAPVEFRRRNLFVGSSIGRRV